MVSRIHVVGAALVTMLVLLGALVGSGIVLLSVPDRAVGPGSVFTETTNNFDQLVVVLMENKNLNEVYGPATFLTQLADQFAFATGWSSITNPSQPNYIALIGGSTFGVSGDGNHPNLNHPTIVDLLENAGKSWKAFAEDASGTGCGLNPPRGEDHFPFLSYTTVTGNSSRCANLLPGSSNEVLSAFNAGTNFIWLTPNDCNNMHSCSVAQGDAWLASWVPALLAAMVGKKAALMITFDEGYTTPPDVFTSFSGPAANLAFKSSASYTHYSFIKLLEDVWGGGNLGQNDVTAPSPLEFFLPGGPDFSLTANPTSVSFGTGQSASSTISLVSTGGFGGTVDLTAVSVPAGVTTSCVPSSFSGNSTSACTLTASNPGAYVVTITGTNGTLVHPATIDATVSSPDFSLTANPNSVSFVVNNSATSAVALQSTFGFSGNVSLTTTSSPFGVTTSCSPPTLVGNQSSTCTMNATTIGSYTIVIQGTSGNLTHTASIDVSVTPVPQPDFSLLANPSAVTFVSGQAAPTTIRLQSTGGFTGTVDLTNASSPTGLTVACAPSSIAGNETSTCTLSGSTLGSYTATITGTNGSLVHTASISVQVTAPPPVPDFSLTASPTAISFASGDFGSSTISIVPTGGFSETVSLTAASNPVGLTTVCSPASIQGSQVAICTIGGRTAGLFRALITGTSGSLLRSVSISVAVMPGAPKPDTIPPQITITSPSPSNSSVVPFATVTVTGNASDNVALQTVELSTDNVTWIRTNGTASWSANITIEPGTTTIYARATDTAGNRKTVLIHLVIEPLGGLPPPPPADGSPLVVDTPIPVHFMAILFGIAGAVEACLFLWTRRHQLLDAIGDDKPVEPKTPTTMGPLAFFNRLLR